MPTKEIGRDEEQALDIIRRVAFGDIEVKKANGRIVLVTKLRETFTIN